MDGMIVRVREGWDWIGLDEMRKCVRIGGENGLPQVFNLTVPIKQGSHYGQRPIKCQSKCCQTSREFLLFGLFREEHYF